MDPYRSAPTSDLYSLYLRAYLSATTGGDVGVPETATTQEMQAVALGIEDARCFAHQVGQDINDDDHLGYRERWSLLEIIAAHEASEEPDEENDDEE